MKKYITPIIFLFILNLHVDAGFSLLRSDKGISAKSGKKIVSLGRYHALMIGINAYENQPRLQSAVKDVKDIARVLKGQYGFESFTLLLDKEATRSKILKAFRKIRDGMKKDDNILIYYAGHGIQIKHTGDGFWLPVDATKSEETWISTETLQRYIKGFDSKHVLLISDSCFSGKLTRAALHVNTGERWVEQAAANASYQVITSGGLEPVSDAGKNGNSVFAYFLINKLKKQSDNFLMASDLYNDIFKRVSNASQQKPEQGKIQGTFDEGGQFVFARLSGPSNKFQDVEVIEENKPEPENLKNVTFNTLLPARYKGDIHIPGKIIEVAGTPNSNEIFCIIKNHINNEIDSFIHVLDFNSHEFIKAIEVQSQPKWIRTVNNKIVVYCPTAGVLNIIDSKSKELVNVILLETNDKAIDLMDLFTDTDCDTILARIKQNKVVSIDIVKNKVKIIKNLSCDKGHCLSLCNNIICKQTNLGGSPSGKPTFIRLQDSKILNIYKVPHNSHSPAKISNKGKLFLTSVKNSVIMIDSSAKKNHKSINGVMFKNLPQANALITINNLSYGAKPIDKLHLTWYDSNSGSEIQKHTLILPMQVSSTLTYTSFVDGNEENMMTANNTFHEFKPLLQNNIAPRAITRVHIAGDYIVIAISLYALKDTRSSRQTVGGFNQNTLTFYTWGLTNKLWLSFKAPKIMSGDALSAPGSISIKPFPKECKVGKALSWSIGRIQKKGEKLTLSKFPKGMKLDPHTGMISFKATMFSIGRYYIKIESEIKGQKNILANFPFRVYVYK
jgi:hypothetical protein